MTFKDIHELLVSSVRLLLRDLIKFIVDNNDSKALAEESMENKVVVKFCKHGNVFRNGILNSQYFVFCTSLYYYLH